MSLVKGVTLSVIEEHLAVLFCITAQPDRNKHCFEQLLNLGRACARLIMKPMYETYGTYDPPTGVNHDSDDGGYCYHAFGRDDVAQLEQEIIDHVNLHRTTILAEVEQ
jgi:hypothetical protein